MSLSRTLLSALVLSSLCLAACGSPDDELMSRQPEPLTSEEAGAGSPESEATVDCTHPPTLRKDQICWRWHCDRADMSEGTWSGNAAACNAGDISASGRNNALKVVNLYRFLANLPAVGIDATEDTQAQQCALMMHANMALSHAPPTTWKCYSSTGATVAGRSNIATAPAVGAVDLYMADPGNPTTIGHRRWILSNSLGPIGIGSTSSYSCMEVIGGTGTATAPWLAWPPPGTVPIQMFTAVSFAPLDTTGWTVQSDSINLAAAKVEVKDAGVVKPVTVTQLGAYYGSHYAISFVPHGWTTQAGHSYTVTITGVTPTITYTVQPTTCP